MELLYFIGVLVFGTILHKNLRARIDSLTRELAAQRSEIWILENSIRSLRQQRNTDVDSPSAKTKALNAEQSPPVAPVEPKASLVTSAPNFSKERRPLTPKWNFRNSAFWKNLDAQFSGNVTGLVGTLAVVLGVVFLGVYAAIQLDPIGRFGVVGLFSVVLYALSFFLKRKLYWRNISLWIRSGSGIIFLMGCLGSVGIESMKWIYDPWLGLGLLSLGLAVNLVLGFLNGGEAFASIHVIFSLFALALIPVNQVTFSVAVLVAFVGVVMSSKNRHWDKHLIATTLGFTFLHAYWLYSFKMMEQEFPVESILAILLCLVLGAAGIVSHYRRSYETTSFHRIPLLAHIVTWVTLGLNLYAHSRGSGWSSVFLALAAVLVFGLSTKANRLSIHWLAVCDRLVSLLLALLAAVSLRNFGLSNYEISVISAIVAAIFLRVLSQTLEKTTFRISNAILLFGYLVVAIQTLLVVADSEPAAGSSIFLLLGSYLILAYVFPYIQKRLEEVPWGFTYKYNLKTFSSSFVEIPFSLHGFMGLLLVAKGGVLDWFLLVPIGMLILAAILRSRQKNLFLDFSILVGTGLSVLVCLGLTRRCFKVS